MPNQKTKQRSNQSHSVYGRLPSISKKQRTYLSHQSIDNAMEKGSFVVQRSSSLRTDPLLPCKIRDVEVLDMNAAVLTVQDGVIKEIWINQKGELLLENLTCHINTRFTCTECTKIFNCLGSNIRKKLQGQRSPMNLLF